MTNSIEQTPMLIPQYVPMANAPTNTQQHFLDSAASLASAQSKASVSSIGVGEKLYKGDSLASENGRYVAEFDGHNLIVHDLHYPNEDGVIITINNKGKGIAESKGNANTNFVEVTAQGNLEVKTDSGELLWSTHTGMDFESEYLYNGEQHTFTLTLRPTGYLRLSHDNDGDRYLWDSHIYVSKRHVGHLYLGDTDRFRTDKASGEFIPAAPTRDALSNEFILRRNLARLENQFAIDLNGDGVGKIKPNPQDTDVRPEILQALEGLEVYYGIDFSNNGIIGKVDLVDILTFIHGFKDQAGIDLLSRPRIF